MKKKLLTVFTGIASIVLAFTAIAFGACKKGDPKTKYKVSYVSGVAGVTENAPAEKSYAKGEVFTLSENTFTYEGYTFTGWNDGTTTYQPEDEYTMPAKAVTFTAQWKANDGDPETTYTVTFDPNNADEPEIWTVEVADGARVAKPETDPTVDSGKLFHYWMIEGGAEYDFNSPVTENITLTAKYDNKITFSLGEGVEGTAPADIWFGYRTQLTFTTPVREGYTFKCWTDGTNEYKSDDYITATVTLTAVWEEESTVPPVSSYTVTFRKANTWDEDVLATITGEIPTMENQQAGAKFNLPANPFARQYYAFAGWSDGTTTYQPGDEYTMPAKNVAFRAEWTEVYMGLYTDDEDGYIFLPDTRDGSYTDGTFAYYDESLDTSDEADPFREVTFSYTVSGSALSITSPFTATGTLKTNGLDITINYNGTNYVFGTPDLVAPTVTFKANGGSGTAPEYESEYNSNSGMYQIVLPANTFTAPEGMAFKCWSIDGREYKAGTSYMAKPGETVTITAVWESAAPAPEYEGVIFEGSCTTPTKSIFGSTTGGETYVKFIVDIEKYSVVYFTSNGIEQKVTVTDNGYFNYKPAIYGEDVYYLDIKMENVAYILLIKKDMTKLYLCDENDNLLTDGEFTARAEDSEWVTILTGEGSEFYNMCEGETKLYFKEAFECGGTTFLGIQFFKNSLGIGVKTIYVSNGEVKVLTSTVSLSGTDSENGSLLVFTSSSYEIKIGKKADGNYYVTSFKYKTTDTTERALSETTAPSF